MSTLPTKKPSKTTRRLLAAAGVAVGLAGVAAAPVLAQDDGSSAPPAAEAGPDAGADHQRPSPEEREARRAELTEALAAQLGVSVEDLTAAQDAAKAAVQDAFGEPTRPERDPDATEEEREAAREAMRAQVEERKALYDQTLADTLGISVDELTAARQAVAIAKVQERLDAGEITQEQADAIIERIESGEWRGPGRHRGRHHGEGRDGQEGAPPADEQAPPAADASGD